MTYSPPGRGSFVLAVKDLRDAARARERAAGLRAELLLGSPVPAVQRPGDGPPPSQWHGPDSGNGYLPADNARIDAAGRHYREWRRSGFRVHGAGHRPGTPACPVHQVEWTGPGPCWADGADGVRCGPAAQGPAGDEDEETGKA